MNILRHIQIVMPNTDPDITDGLLAELSHFGIRVGTTLMLTPSQKGFLPEMHLAFASVDQPQAIFTSSLGQIMIEISNFTGRSKQSPHPYSPISLAEYHDRAAKLRLTVLDHIGFDLPWFDGVHPEVQKLRSELKTGTAYHRSFTGDDWDFVLPAGEEELLKADLDYSVVRRPKFEIVSISKVSTPIIQFDFSADTSFDELVRLFPEGIADPGLQNVWVYIKNGFGIDICMVVGVDQGEDWSNMFKGHRL